MNTRLIGALIVSFVFFVVLAAAPDDSHKTPCTYGCRDCCGNLGCVPEDTSLNRDLIKPKQKAGQKVKTFCAKCLRDADCGGSKCGRDGFCASDTAALAPRSFWPSFHLLTTEIAFAKDTSSLAGFALHPVIGAGYLFEGAFRKVTPLKRADGSYVVADVPAWYWDAGGSLAFSTGSQNAFGQLGLSYYHPVIFLSTYSLLGLYQRNGAALWKAASSNRAGAALSLGILNNAYIKGGYLWSLDNKARSGAYIAVAYMKDLLSALPDRYLKFLPK